MQIGPQTEILHGNLNRFQARGCKKCVRAKGMQTVRSDDFWILPLTGTSHNCVITSLDLSQSVFRSTGCDMSADRISLTAPMGEMSYLVLFPALKNRSISSMCVNQGSPTTSVSHFEPRQKTSTSCSRQHRFWCKKTPSDDWVDPLKPIDVIFRFLSISCRSVLRIHSSGTTLTPAPESRSISTFFCSSSGMYARTFMWVIFGDVVASTVSTVSPEGNSSSRCGFFLSSPPAMPASFTAASPRGRSPFNSG